MVKPLPLKRLVVELRYKPDLGFYSKMDSVGQALLTQFPDWVRSPLSLEVRNKKHHRRVFLSYRRCFFQTDIDDSHASRVFESAEGALREVWTGLELTEFTRLGMRQWFAADLEKSFAAMVDDIAARFLRQDEELASILPHKMSDVGYVVDCETDEGWKYHLRLGPITKQQWQELVEYEPEIFEPSGREEAATLEAYLSSIPDNFLYLDIDCFQEHVRQDAIAELLTTFRRTSHQLASDLIRYCKS